MATPAIPLIVQSGSRLESTPRRQSDEIGVHSSSSESPPPLAPSPETYELEDLLKPADNEWLKEGLPDTEFNRTYPPDPWGEEAADNARVWKLYRDQLSASDKGMLETWSKTVDVLLIFAGLFSAVLTAFLLEAYKNLQPDYVQYIAAFLYASAANNLTAGTLLAHGVLLSPDKMLQTTSAQRLTNGLWFMSLFFSLAVALLSILLKQWLDEYDSHISASAPSLKYWVRRHQLYSAGMRKWGLPSIISCLPMLLHFSVFLFFIGLVLFLQPLDSAIAYTLLGSVAATFTFYVLSILMPAWYVDCPWYTPLLRQLSSLRPLFLSARRHCKLKWEALRYLIKKKYMIHVSRMFGLKWRIPRHPHRHHRYRGWGRYWSLETCVTREEGRIRERGDELDGFALITLLRQTNDPAVIAVGNEAFGAFNRSAACIAYSALSREHVMSIRFQHAPTGGSNTAHYARRLRACYWASDVLCASFMIRGGALDLSLRLGASGTLLHFLDQTLPSDDAALEQVKNLARRISQVYSLLRPRGHPRTAGPAGDSPNSVLGRICPRSMSLLFLSALKTINYSLRDLPEDTEHDSTELSLVLLELGGLLKAPDTRFNIERPAQAPVLRGFNTLCLLLSDAQKYPLIPGTAAMVAEHFVFVVQRIVPRWPVPSNHKIPWSELHALPALARSPFLKEHIAGDAEWRSVLCALMRNVDVNCADRNGVQQFWECAAALGKCGCDIHFSTLVSKCFPQRTVSPRFETFESYLCGDNDQAELLLQTYLTGDFAVGTWTDYLPSVWHVTICTELADGIASLLCRRVRAGIASDGLVRAFFAGEFVADTIRYHLRDPLHYGNYVLGTILAKHCVQLSLSSWSAIYAKLEAETLRDDDRARGALMAGHLAKLREFVTRNGEFDGECDGPCYCKCPIPMQENVEAKRGIRRFLPRMLAAKGRDMTAPVSVNV